MCLNGAIFDIENGTILKLAEGQEVVRAMKGYKALTQKEIKQLYGSPPVFSHYVWPNTTNLTSKRGGYWACISYFDTPKVALFLTAVEMIE